MDVLTEQSKKKFGSKDQFLDKWLLPVPAFKKSKINRLPYLKRHFQYGETRGG
jgi:hypothetical protein